MKRFLFIFSLTIALLSSTAASFSSEARQVRVVSLAPATTEILFALGLDEEIVGVSRFCNYPAATRLREKVGTFSQPNIEKIISLRPDIIFCTGLEQASSIAKLRQLGLNVFVSDPSDFEGLFVSVRRMGAFLDRPAHAAALIEEMRAGIETVRAKTAAVPPAKRPKVFVELWGSPLTTAGKGSFVDEMIALAGGVNIAYDVRRPYGNFSVEKVMRRDPDCIVVAYMLKAGAAGMVAGRFGWSGIAAVKSGRVYDDIDPDILLRPGPRLIDGLRELHRRFYP